MKTVNSRPVAFKYLCLVLALFGPFTLLYARDEIPQKRFSSPAAFHGKQRKDLPSLNKNKITLKFKFDGMEAAEITQFEGEAITIEKDGITLEIIPSLDEDQVKVKVKKLFPVMSQGQPLGNAGLEMGVFEVGKESREITWGEMGLRVQLVNIKEDSKVKKKDDQVSSLFSQNTLLASYLPQDGPDLFGDVCCIMCSGARYCGCSINVPGCGGCCVGACCY
jgi:hypothetical protein